MRSPLLRRMALCHRFSVNLLQSLLRFPFVTDGAMQAREYAMAQWAIGLRVPVLNNAAVEAACIAGKFFERMDSVPPGILWRRRIFGGWCRSRRLKSTLSAPHVSPVGMGWKTFKRSNAITAKSGAGGQHLTRATLQEQLRRGKIVADGPRLSYLMMQAENDGIICSGPRQGKQFTYALLDERVPPTAAIAGKRPWFAWRKNISAAAGGRRRLMISLTGLD